MEITNTAWKTAKKTDDVTIMQKHFQGGGNEVICTLGMFKENGKTVRIIAQTFGTPNDQSTELDNIALANVWLWNAANETLRDWDALKEADDKRREEARVNAQVRAIEEREAHRRVFGWV